MDYTAQLQQLIDNTGISNGNQQQIIDMLAASNELLKIIVGFLLFFTIVALCQYAYKLFSMFFK